MIKSRYFNIEAAAERRCDLRAKEEAEILNRRIENMKSQTGGTEGEEGVHQRSRVEELGISYVRKFVS